MNSLLNVEFFDDICFFRDILLENNSKLIEFRKKLKLDAEFHGIDLNDADIKELEIISLDELSKGQASYIALLELFIYESYGKKQSFDEMNFH